MNKLIILFFAFSLCACATQPLKSADLQSKVATGMSIADVISILDIPTERKSQEPGKIQLIYPGYVMNFADGQLRVVQATSGDTFSELSLKSVDVLLPGYKADSLILNKDFKPAVGAYRVASYLQNETLFVQAAEAGVFRNGFTMKTNALCVAMTEGYLKGAQAVFKAGYYPDVRLRTDQGTYIFPKGCLDFQKNPTVAEQLKKMLADSDAERAELVAKKTARLKAAELKTTSDVSADLTSSDNSKALEKNVEPEDEDSKFSFDWQAVKDFLKPVGPLPDGRRPEPSKTAPNNPEPAAQKQ
jgi:hypothetical protein